MRRAVLAALCTAAVAVPAAGQTYNLNASWSDAVNPNGVWSLNEGANALPRVASWQGLLGGWSVAQPGWARAENTDERIPFFFKSNGSEIFERDYLAGDVVCHTWDATNGVGNGEASVVWTAPAHGAVRISGGVWIGRDIGRAVDWSITANGVQRTSGSIFSGDPFSRANPFLLSAGSGGASALKGIIVFEGQKIVLNLVTASVFGDFVGIDYTVTLRPIACLGDANGDNQVNFIDLNLVLSDFGQTGAGLPGDVNDDDAVDFLDLNYVLSRYGSVCIPGA